MRETRVGNLIAIDSECEGIGRRNCVSVKDMGELRIETREPLYSRVDRVHLIQALGLYKWTLGSLRLSKTSVPDSHLDPRSSWALPTRVHLLITSKPPLLADDGGGKHKWTTSSRSEPRLPDDAAAALPARDAQEGRVQRHRRLRHRRPDCHLRLFPLARDDDWEWSSQMPDRGSSLDLDLGVVATCKGE